MKKVLIIIGVVAVIGAMIGINVMRGNGSSFVGGREETVEAMVVSRDTITSSIIITGTVEEIDTRDLVPELSVKVEQVLVEKGDHVAEGDVLFVLDTSDLDREIAKLSNNLEVQNLTLKRLQSVSVTNDLTSATLALSQAELSLGSAQRNYNSLSNEMEKNQQLYDAGIMTAVELDNAKDLLEEASSQMEIAAINYRSMEAELNQLSKNNKQASVSGEIDEAIQLKTIEGIELSLDELISEKNLLEAMTKAPMAGVMTTINIEAGDIVPAMTVMGTVTDLSRLQVKANIREYDIAEVLLGQEVIISGDAIERGTTVTGVIGYVAPTAEEMIINNRQVTAVEVIIDINEGQSALKPGYTTECEIITSKMEDVITVSYDVLTKSDKDEDMVFVVDEEGVARERLIELGATSDFDAQVIDGLEEGETVIINPSLTIFDGTKVVIDQGEEGN